MVVRRLVFDGTQHVTNVVEPRDVLGIR
jgi:hypothetical protein